MNYLSYNLTNKYIFFLWKGYYCGCYDMQCKELYLMWEDEQMNKAVNEKLKELGHEDIKR